MRKFNSKGCIGKLVVCALVMSFPLCAQAQQAPIGFSAEAALAAGTDSNVLRLSDNETSDTILEVAPELNFVELYGKHRFEAKYEGNYVRFSDFDNLNYADHRGTLNAKLEHTTRLRTEFTYKYQNIVELPGTNDSITQIVDSFNKLKQKIINARVIYGRNDAIGQFQIDYENAKRDYTNNNQDFRDYNFDKFTSTFFYRVTSSTRLVIEGAIANLSYKSNISNPGSKYTNLLLGIEWRPSVKLLGIFKVGQQTQDFENSETNDIAGLAYFADFFWRPNSYSVIKLGANRSTKESSEIEIGSFVSTEYILGAKHEFTQKLEIEADFILGEDDLVISNSVTLERQEFQLRLIYKNYAWLNTFFGLKHFSRNSNRPIYEVDTNQILIGLTGNFG